MLQLFQGDALRLRIKEQHHKKLRHHHHSKKQKRRSARRLRNLRENVSDQCVHHPSQRTRCTPPAATAANSGGSPCRKSPRLRKGTKLSPPLRSATASSAPACQSLSSPAASPPGSCCRLLPPADFPKSC